MKNTLVNHLSHPITSFLNFPGARAFLAKENTHIPLLHRVKKGSFSKIIRCSVARESTFDHAVSLKIDSLGPANHSFPVFDSRGYFLRKRASRPARRSFSISVLREKLEGADSYSDARKSASLLGMTSQSTPRSVYLIGGNSKTC